MCAWEVVASTSHLSLSNDHRVLVMTDLLCLLQVFECLAGREDERIQLLTVAFRLR